MPSHTRPESSPRWRPDPGRFEIIVETTFHASHAIRLPDGTVEDAHAHEWRLTVTVGRDRLDALGLVMDFHELERLVAAAIGPARDGDFNAIEPFGAEPGLHADTDAAPMNPAVNPTAEHIAAWLGNRLGKHLPPGVTLLNVTLEEAPHCRARWRPRCFSV